MKKFVILLLAALILLSGCVGQKAAVKNGDNISVNYIGRLPDGKVFDTNIETVAKENNLFIPEKKYTPYQFIVGKRIVIQGFDEGVIGMKVGETRKLTIPPEKAYGLSNLEMIRVIPILENVPLTRVIPKVFEVPRSQFEQFFGPNHSVGDTVKIPETNINITIMNYTSEVSLKRNLTVGFNIWDARAPWNETVVKIDDKNITLKANLKKNDIVQLQGAPWNTTVVGLDNVNITLRHNPIPETTVNVPGMFGQLVPMKISFNETSIILDQNHELADKTLVFNVTLVSINK